MGQQEIDNGDSGLVARTKINENFTEVYDVKIEATNSTITGDNNTVLAGDSNTIEADNSIASGTENQIIPFPERALAPDYTAAIGRLNEVYSLASVAIGTGCKVDGIFGIALGNNCIASGNDSMALGGQAITGRRKFTPIAHGADDLHGEGGGVKGFILIDPSEGDMTPIFPNVIVYDPSQPGNLIWALHPYCILFTGESTGSFYLIIKSEYTGGVGTKVWYDNATDLGADYTILSSYAPQHPAGFEGGNSMTAEGKNCNAVGTGAHAEGYYTESIKTGAHSEGGNTRASEVYAHAEGKLTKASGEQSHAEGSSTTANANNSHAEGNITTASGVSSHAEGQSTLASGLNSHAEGSSTIASGEDAHAEGLSSEASADYSHAEGKETTASALQSHAEGISTEASGINSHAEGQLVIASGNSAHAEGLSTEASGVASHSQGNETKASGHYSSAEGNGSESKGNSSKAIGRDSYALRDYQFSHGTTKFSEAGDAQYTRIISKISGAGAGWWDLIILDGIEYRTSYVCETMLVGKQFSTTNGMEGESCAYKYNWMLNRGTKNDFATTDVNISTNQITVSQVIKTNTKLLLTTTGTIPAGLNTTSILYAIYVDDTHIKLSLTESGAEIDITSQGVGTHSYSLFNLVTTTKQLIGRSFIDDGDSVGDGLTTGIRADIYTSYFANERIRIRIDGIATRSLRWVATSKYTEVK